MMADSDNDEDLKRAIALSLEEVPKQEKKKEKRTVVIDLLSDDEDDDDLDAPVGTKHSRTSGPPELKTKKEPGAGIPTVPDLSKKAPSTQKAVPSPEPSSNQDSKPLSVPLSTPQQPPPAVQTGLLGFDRKKMELERLARVNQKRKREEESTSLANDSRKRVATAVPNAVEQEGTTQDVKRLLFGQSMMVQPGNSKISSLSTMDANSPKEAQVDAANVKGAVLVKDQNKSTSTAGPLGISNNIPKIMPYQNQQPIISNIGIQYPDGVMKKTWVFGCPREGDDIKIEEVLQNKTLEIAVLSAFQIDTEWILSKLDPKTKVIWVVQAKEEETKQEMIKAADKNFRFCFPSMEGQINLPSANLVSYDWGESGVMENICFLIDLPRLPGGQMTDLKDLTHFGKELFHFVTAMGLDPRMIESMRKFDYSRTSHLAFVHTIGGSHMGAQWKRTGYCGLATSIRSLGLATDDVLDVDFVTASIGALNDSFIQAMYLAAQGDDGMTEYGWRTARSKEVTETERELPDGLKDRCRIYFPTRDTVAKSRGGIGAGGTICFQPKWYGKSFPRHLMRDCKSQREGILMHNKMWFVRPHKGASRAWAYLGSANLSESAWGRLVKDKTTKEPKMICRNWECGVIFPVPTASRSGVHPENFTQSGDAKPNMKVFQGHVPIPMVVPGEEFGNRRPWFYSEG